MNHDETEVLLSLAQVAVAFAGFSAIVVLFGRGDGGRWRRAHADRFHGMVVHAMVAVFFCLLPLLLGALTTDRATIWDVASVLLGLEIVLHVSGVLVMPTTIGIGSRLLIGTGYAFAAIQFMNVAGIDFDHEFRAYLIGVVWHVVMSGMLFLLLIWIPRSEVIPE